MIRVVFIFIVAIVTISCNTASHSPSEVEPLLQQLDSALQHHASYTADKENRIATLRSLDRNIDAASRYQLYDRLYSEYYSFDFDSAAVYAIRKREAAREAGNRVGEALASLNLARAELARGHEADALLAIKEAETDTIHPEIRATYFDAMIAFEEAHDRIAIQYYNRRREELDSQSHAWVYNESNRLRALNRQAEALDLMKRNRNRLSNDVRGRAISNYITGRLYLELGDSISAIHHYCISAINDVMTPVRDYSSLLELTSLLFAYGDIERAYRYINVTVKDLNASSVNANIIATSKLIPAIISAYDSRNKTRQEQQHRLIIGIVILSVLLGAALIWARKAHHKTARIAAEEVELNHRLHEINDSLAVINKELSESNKVKEAYIVQYLNLCSYYIECVDRYRNNLRAVARNKGVDEMLYMLNSGSTIDKELKEFYNSFDTTFLQLFPDFVEQLNELLEPDKRISLRPGELLTTELRVFALIRLGITDSEQIASFLRRSISTIYNYRVKMRNAAQGMREDFELRVSQISSNQRVQNH